MFKYAKTMERTTKHSKKHAYIAKFNPKSALTGLPHESLPIVGNIHLIFIMTLYKKRKDGSCSLVVIKNKIKFTKKIES